MSFAEDLVQAAEDEFSQYGSCDEKDPPLRKRIGAYWSNLKIKGRDGATDVPWSAAFISMMVHLAMKDSGFHAAQGHWFYIGRAIENALNGGNDPFDGYRVADVTIRPGDILGMNRADQARRTYDKSIPKGPGKYPGYESHCDIVVKVDAHGVHTIGGNVENQVRRKVFVLGGDGLLVNSQKPNQAVFVVLRRR